MAKTMKAAVVRQFKMPLSIEEVPVPEVDNRWFPACRPASVMGCSVP
ncbi:hypothetical protein FBZ83_104191 [Azospirillum brasilense]|uniref:Uncharacterized protein n=1 Tax=Azospirillum brasilense TaxID=192 RepID=A0A560CJ88_AZOBR|nr:hypothetical protein FBZ83_104191 [Azospirillum brasilense]